MNNYSDFAQSIVARNRQRYNPKNDPLMRETDELFYWIMELFLAKVEGFVPPRTKYELDVAANHNGNRIVVSYGRNKEYLPSPDLNVKEFFEVMQNVANIINSFENYKTIFHANGKSARLIVFMEI